MNDEEYRVTDPAYFEFVDGINYKQSKRAVKKRIQELRNKPQRKPSTIFDLLAGPNENFQIYISERQKRCTQADRDRAWWGYVLEILKVGRWKADLPLLEREGRKQNAGWVKESCDRLRGLFQKHDRKELWTSHEENEAIANLESLAELVRIPIPPVQVVAAVPPASVASDAGSESTLLEFAKAKGRTGESTHKLADALEKRLEVAQIKPTKGGRKASKGLKAMARQWKDSDIESQYKKMNQ